MSDVSVTPLASGPVGRQASGRLVVRSRGPGLVAITDAVARFVGDSGIRHGLATLFCRHTSASLLINENADRDVARDLLAALDRLAPRDAPYRHTVEGADDMPAHIRSVLTGASLPVPIADGRLVLGRWQGIFLAEHRDAPHAREVHVHLLGT